MASSSRRLYVVVSEGASPEEATPIIATGDRRVVAAVAEAIARALGADELPGRLKTAAAPEGV